MLCARRLVRVASGSPDYKSGEEGVGGAWFPYSVYRARGELFIMRDPRPGRWHREERYGLARLDSEVLWLYEPPFEDEEHPPCHSLVFRRGR